MQSAAAISEHLDTRTAGIEVAALLDNALDGPTDLVLVFASFHHREALEDAIEYANSLGEKGKELPFKRSSGVYTGVKFGVVREGIEIPPKKA